MAILSGRTGKVSYDPTGAGGATLVELASINAWTLDASTEMEDVSCFGDANRVYLPGLRDAQGTLGGFFNSTDLTLWEATVAPSPGMLQLMSNETDAAATWSGKAYLDASIDCSLAAPKVSAKWYAAGPWTFPAAA
jgi:hypothetical protein